MIWFYQFKWWTILFNYKNPTNLSKSFFSQIFFLLTFTVYWALYLWAGLFEGGRKSFWGKYFLCSWNINFVDDNKGVWTWANISLKLSIACKCFLNYFFPWKLKGFFCWIFVFFILLELWYFKDYFRERLHCRWRRVDWRKFDFNFDCRYFVHIFWGIIFVF